MDLEEAVEVLNQSLPDRLYNEGAFMASKADMYEEITYYDNRFGIEIHVWDSEEGGELKITNLHAKMVGALERLQKAVRNVPVWNHITKEDVSFEEWRKWGNRCMEVIYDHDHDYMQGQSGWKESYEAGLTPHEALKEDFSYA